jgi:hypothetical protein
LTISKPVCPIFDNAPRENKNDKQRSSGTQEGASRRQSERLHDSEILTTEDITRSDETVADQGRFALWLGRELPCAGEISAPFDRPPSPVPARSQPQTVHRSVADTEGLNGSVTASPAPRHRSPGRSAILAPTKVGRIAMPLVSFYPPEKEGGQPPLTHFYGFAALGSAHSPLYLRQRGRMCSSIDAGPRTLPVLALRRTRGCWSSQKCNSRAKADKVGGIDSSAATRRCASAIIASLSDARPPVRGIGAASAVPVGGSDCLRSNSRSAMLISTPGQRP